MCNIEQSATSILRYSCIMNVFNCSIKLIFYVFALKSYDLHYLLIVCRIEFGANI